MGPSTTRHRHCCVNVYAQYRAMRLAELPVIALRIERVTSWGNLSVGADEADHDGQA